MPYVIEPCRYYSYPSHTKLWRFLPCNRCCYFGGGGYPVYCCCTPADDQYILDLGGGWPYRGSFLCPLEGSSVCNAYRGKIVVDLLLPYGPPFCYNYRYQQTLCPAPSPPTIFTLWVDFTITGGGLPPPNPPNFTPYYAYHARVGFYWTGGGFIAYADYESALFPLPPLSDLYSNCNWWKSLPTPRVALTRYNVVDGLYQMMPGYYCPCNPNTSPSEIYLESA